VGPTVFYRSLRQIGAGVFTALHERLELVCIELQEEKFRIIQALILINAAVFSAWMALLFVTLLVVYSFPPERRILVLGCVSFLYAGVCAGTVLALVRNLKRQRRVLPETRQALATDHACIRPAS